MSRFCRGKGYNAREGYNARVCRRKGYNARKCTLTRLYSTLAQMLVILPGAVAAACACPDHEVDLCAVYQSGLDNNV